jgi:hypothetical protein
MAISRSATFRTHLAVFSLLAAAVASSHAQGRFTVSADGQEVLDTSSRLSWRRCAEGLQWDGKTCSGKLAKFSYAEAKQRAAGAAKAGAKAWRIPSKDELVGLVDKTAKKKPKIDFEAFPKTPSTLFWATRPGTDDNLNAWLVSFANGKVMGNVGQAKFPLRMVRAGS